jgi:hypothetical protein
MDICREYFVRVLVLSSPPETKKNGNGTRLIVHMQHQSMGVHLISSSLSSNGPSLLFISTNEQLSKSMVVEKRERNQKLS